MLLKLKGLGSSKDAHVKEENIGRVIHGMIHILYVLKTLEDFPIFTSSVGKILKINRFLVYFRHLT